GLAVDPQIVGTSVPDGVGDDLLQTTKQVLGGGCIFDAQLLSQLDDNVRLRNAAHQRLNRASQIEATIFAERGDDGAYVAKQQLIEARRRGPVLGGVALG